MSLSVQLRQERAAIVREMSQVLAGNRADKMARWRELDTKQEELRARIEQSERETELAEVRNPQRPGFGDPNMVLEARELTADEQRLASPEYRRAFNNYARTADKAELRALGSGSGADGAALVPTGFQREIEVHLKAIGGLRRCARIVTTATGNNLPWPNEIDTNSGTDSGTYNAGSWLAESAPTTEVDPTYSNVTLYANTIDSGLVLVPVELMQDSAFSIESELSRTFGTRLGRGTAAAYQNGNNLSPGITGLIPELQAAGGRSVLAVGANNNSGNSGDTDLNSLGSDDFANVIEAVDPAYRVGANVGWLANQATYDTLRKVKDKYGRPIWEVSLAGGTPDKILGYPYWYDQSMSKIGAGNVSLIFGDFSKYIIRDVLGMTMIRYNELFMQNRQVGYQAYMRTFGKTLNAQAFAYIVHPLS